MKIFGWMHKQLHLGTTEYHRVAHRSSPDVVLGDESGGRRGAMLAARVKERDTEALLLPHVLLTIGTFGHHPNPHQQITQLQQEQEPLSTDHEQDLNPAAIKQGPAPAAPNTTATAAAAASLRSESISKPAESAAIEQPVKKQEALIEEEITSQEPLLKEDKEKIERRTTLADLFAAETARGAGGSSDAAMSLSADKWQTATCPTKNAKKTTKELPPSAAVDGKKIYQLITRMLKKRIHPDQLARAGEERSGRKRASDDGGEEKRRANYCLPRR